MTAPAPTADKIHIRWMIRRNMPEVMQIENDSFEFPWPEEEFVKVLRLRNCIGMVAEIGERVVGYDVYCLHKSRLHIINFAVAVDARRKGVGRAMIDKLKWKLSQHADRRNRLLLEVRETNLLAQMFFRSLNFRAVTCRRTE